MFTKRIDLKQEITIKRVDLGCGNSYEKENTVGVDLEDFGQEVVWDLRSGIPFPNNSVEEIYISHFLEHLEDIDIDPLFAEMRRVCKSGAIITIRGPRMGTPEQYFPSHVSDWGKERIEGICKGYNLHGDIWFEILENKDLFEFEFQAKLKVHK